VVTGAAPVEAEEVPSRRKPPLATTLCESGETKVLDTDMGLGERIVTVVAAWGVEMTVEHDAEKPLYAAESPQRTDSAADADVDDNALALDLENGSRWVVFEATLAGVA